MTHSLLAIPIAFALVYFPHFISLAARIKMGFDNNAPRDQQAKLEGWGRRATAAHQNSWESFAPFAAAVLVSHVAHGDPRTSSLLCVVYLGTRALYVLAYVGDKSTIRSALWFASFLATMALFLLPLSSG